MVSLSRSIFKQGRGREPSSLVDHRCQVGGTHAPAQHHRGLNESRAFGPHATTDLISSPPPSASPPESATASVVFHVPPSPCTPICFCPPPIHASHGSPGSWPRREHVRLHGYTRACPTPRPAGPPHMGAQVHAGTPNLLRRPRRTCNTQQQQTEMHA